MNGSLAAAGWSAGEINGFCASRCSAHTFVVDSEPYITEPVTTTQDVCETGGTVEFNTTAYEAGIVVTLAMVFLVCAIFYNYRRIRAHKAAGEPCVVNAVLVSEGPGFLPVAVPVQPEALSRLSNVVEAVAVLTIPEGGPPARP